MIISFDNYYSAYHERNEDIHEDSDIKFLDNWQDCIKLIPFTSNASGDIYDKNCGLVGVVGEFVRLCEQSDNSQIVNFNKDILVPVKTYLKQNYNMSDSKIDKFIFVLKDILWNTNTLNIIDSQFLKFLPLLSESNKINTGYINGIIKMAQYAYSFMPQNVRISLDNNNSSNLFTDILKCALANNDNNRSDRLVRYNIKSYILQMFSDDFNWLINQEDSIRIKYLPLFLHFYICFSIIQSIMSLSPDNKNISNSPELFYFILSSEKSISQNAEAVVYGWPQKITFPKILEKLLGRIQALDIANKCLENSVAGFYPEILNKLKETPFEVNKVNCEKILANYQKDKRALLENRKTEVSIPDDDIDTSIDSYEMFLNKLFLLCVRFQSSNYESRLKKKVLNLFSIRFLQNHRKSGYILSLDNEMLIFLIAMITKGKKTKLDDLYKLFKNYGICFNINTRRKIEDILLKLNILDRKSDSGEAQYVGIIL